MRTKAIGLAHGTKPDKSSSTGSYTPDWSIKDVLNLTRKFWKTHSHLIIVMDGAAATLFTIQYNLVAGTIALYAQGRDDPTKFLDDLL